MGIQEERNIATLLRWLHDMWGQGRADLASELVAPRYVGYNPRGVLASSPEQHAAALLGMRRGREGGRFNEVIARGEFAAVRWSIVDPPPDSPTVGGLQVYQFDAEHRIRAMWSAGRSVSAGGWSDGAAPARWTIASSDALTDEERQNERTRQTHLERRLVNDPAGLDELFVDPVPSHGPLGDRLESVSEFAERIRGESTRFPGKRFAEHVHFIVGDRSVEVWGWRWDDSDASEWNGAPLESPFEFIEIWRYEDGKIAERWQVTADPGVDWSQQPA